jgi:eukaryotic-like serine/threonine-protein kinase
VSESYKYWAFISYSHADEAWARWLHRSLESYRIPARLVGRATSAGTVPAKLFPIFRDRDELAGSAELGPELQKALEQSRFQIVIASPHAARSHWVGEEIRHYKSLGRAARVLALIVDGEPGAGDPARECFPEALRRQVGPDGRLTDLPAEPIAADARRGGDGRRHALLKLIAGVLGVGFDELRQRELQARNRRLAFIASLATAISAVTVVLAVFAVQARDDALRRQQQAEDLLQFMLGDLRGKLEPIGKLAILDAVGNKAMDYFATLDEEDLTDAALASRATALRQIGDVRIKQGDMPGAVEAFREALKLDEELVARHPDDAASISHVAASEFSMGYAHYVKGEMEQALPWWQRQVATANRLLQLEPGKPEWTHGVVDANSNLGALVFARKDLDAAQAAFTSALAMQDALVEAEPENRQYLETLASLHGWLCTIAVERRDWKVAVGQAERRAGSLRRLLALERDNAQFQHRLAKANLQTLYTQGFLQAAAPDAPVLRETVRLTTALVELDPDNVEFAHSHAVALNYLVDAHLATDHAHAAERVAGEVLELARKTLQRAPASAVATEDLLAVLAQAAKLAWLRNDRRTATARLQEALALPLGAEPAKAIPASRWLDLHLLAWWMAPARKAAAARAAATAWLERATQAGAVKPELLLRYAALQGNRPEVTRHLAQLTDAERRHPFLQHFCRVTDACGPGDIAYRAE